MTPFVRNSDTWILAALAAPSNPACEGTQNVLQVAIRLGGLIAIAAAPAMAQGSNVINRVGTVDNVDASSSDGRS
jgi:hypothetical protein